MRELEKVEEELEEEMEETEEGFMTQLTFSGFIRGLMYLNGVLTKEQFDEFLKRLICKENDADTK